MNRLAAAAAERPPPPPPPLLLACDSMEDFGTGVDGEVVVLAMEDRVCTSELKSGVFGLEAPVGRDDCKNCDESDKCMHRLCLRRCQAGENATKLL